MNAVPRSFLECSPLPSQVSSSSEQTFAVLPSSRKDLGFYGFVPSSWKGSRWVVSIHGYTRNAAAHITQLAKEAAARQCAVIAPIFPRAEYRSFQTLAPSTSGSLPEDAFERCLEKASAVLGTTEQPPVLGYSGGGQFLHRYIMMRGPVFPRSVLFAPGWYTWPDQSLPYPYGIGPSKALQARHLSIGNTQDAQITVFVGSNDVRRDGSLNTKKSLDRQQGKTRLERAERWVEAMNEALGCRSIKLRQLSGIGHDFTRNVKQRGLASILFDELLSLDSEV